MAFSGRVDDQASFAVAGEQETAPADVIAFLLFDFDEALQKRLWQILIQLDVVTSPPALQTSIVNPPADPLLETYQSIRAR